MKEPEVKGQCALLRPVIYDLKPPESSIHLLLKPKLTQETNAGKSQKAWKASFWGLVNLVSPKSPAPSGAGI